MKNTTTQENKYYIPGTNPPIVDHELMRKDRVEYFKKEYSRTFEGNCVIAKQHRITAMLNWLSHEELDAIQADLYKKFSIKDNKEMAAERRQSIERSFKDLHGYDLSVELSK